ncbi:MAG TPA: DUF523 and DUF1722 domain-containing protein, partial [Verrucomicrobiae bacterium]|nr:DUF523 and DUF1722 domain-containing protein [Verrucomicrobiae bacterium]
MEDRIAVGVSACLLGEKVRYDGGHKHDPYLTGVLARYFRFVPVCPEVGCGLPVPREAMRLEGDPEHPRLVTSRSGIDHTDRMLDYCRRAVRELEKEDLCGFIFKKNSPSSGLFRVKVYQRGMPTRSGSGLFAAAVAAHFPLLPLEEEGRLQDPALRENFIERVFAYRRLQDFLQAPDAGSLVEFHTRHKLQLMAHAPEIYREMGRLVAKAGELPAEELYPHYRRLIMTALVRHATPRKNADVLQHILGH